MRERLSEKWFEIAGSEVDVAPFLNRCFSLGAGLLRSNPDTFERTVSQLLEVASWMPSSQIGDFFSREVTAQTFTFQERFDELVEHSTFDLSDKFAIHINENTLFSSLSESVLVPPSILRPDKALDREDPLNRMNVFFATGPIDDLSIFLAGHALLRSEDNNHTPNSSSKMGKSGDLAPCWVDDLTEQRFSRYFSLAKVDRGDHANVLKKKGPHEIESPVRPMQGFVQLVVSQTAVRFNLINLPATVLLPEQRDKFEQESIEYRNALIASNSKEWSDKRFEKQFANTRQAELMIKLVLLELAEQHTAGNRQTSARLPELNETSL